MNAQHTKHMRQSLSSWKRCGKVPGWVAVPVGYVLSFWAGVSDVEVLPTRRSGIRWSKVSLNLIQPLMTCFDA